MTSLEYHIHVTAAAWDMTESRCRALYNWVGAKIERERRGLVFATMLKRYQGTRDTETAEQGKEINL